MKGVIRHFAPVIVCALALPHMAAAQTAPAIPPSLITPDKVETRIGPLEFKDGAPSAETAEKVSDTLDFTRAPRCVPQQLRRRIGVCDPSGLLSIGAEDNTVAIFSELMDSKSLFLTANADTVYYFSIRGSDEGSDGGRTAAEGARHHQRHVVRVDHRHWLPRSRPRRRRQDTCSCRQAMTGPLPEAVFT